MSLRPCQHLFYGQGRKVPNVSDAATFCQQLGQRRAAGKTSASSTQGYFNSHPSLTVGDFEIEWLRCTGNLIRHGLRKRQRLLLWFLIADRDLMAGQAADWPTAIRSVEFQQGIAMMTTKVDDRQGDLLPKQSAHPKFKSEERPKSPVPPECGSSPSLIGMLLKRIMASRMINVKGAHEPQGQELSPRLGLSNSRASTGPRLDASRFGGQVQFTPNLQRNLSILNLRLIAEILRVALADLLHGLK
jgi:hypothetical protein